MAQLRLSDAIEDFLQFRTMNNKAKGTLKQDRSVLTKFLTVNGNIYCHNITSRHVTLHMQEAGKTKQPASLRNDHNSLAAFFGYCRHMRYMPPDSNPLYGRDLPPAAKRERERLHITQFPTLLDAAERRSDRDRMLVAILIYLMVRDNEAAAIRIRDVDLEAGYITIRVSKKKGVYEDRMPISTELDRELRRWLTIYTTAVGPLDPNYFLLPARDTKPIFDAESGKIVGQESRAYKAQESIGRTGRIVNPILESIGFPVVDRFGRRSGEGSHTIRRSGARAYFDVLVANSYDGALRVVQAMLHHESLIQTEHYIGITADRRTRDELIRGQFMFTAGSNVVPLKQAE